VYCIYDKILKLASTGLPSVDAPLSNQELVFIKKKLLACYYPIHYLDSCTFNTDKFSIIDWDNIIVSFQDYKEGDIGSSVIGELHVGVPEKGYEVTMREIPMQEAQSY